MIFQAKSRLAGDETTSLELIISGILSASLVLQATMSYNSSPESVQLHRYSARNLAFLSKLAVVVYSLC